MSDQFVGQLLLVPYNFPPQGWAFCQGQLLPISQNTALFSLLGTFYGGNGTSNFALPNLQGMMPIGIGNQSGNYSIGQTGGEQNVTLIAGQLPAHSHVHAGTTVLPTSSSPSATAFAQGGGGRGHAFSYYVAPPVAGTLATMSSTCLALNGSGQAHSNMMPSLVLNYIISLVGIYPSRS